MTASFARVSAVALGMSSARRMVVTLTATMIGEVFGAPADQRAGGPDLGTGQWWRQGHLFSREASCIRLLSFHMVLLVAYMGITRISLREGGRYEKCHVEKNKRG